MDLNQEILDIEIWFVIYPEEELPLVTKKTISTKQELKEELEKILQDLIRMGASLVSYRLGYQGISEPVRDLREIRYWWEQKHINLTI